MTDGHWKTIRDTVGGRRTEPLAAFIIDSPWLPNWHGVDILDYFASDETWYAANVAAVERFPGAAFIPGFWAEYGMCTEPSAFGARCSFPRNEFPFAHPLVKRVEDIDELGAPDPAVDGLLPFVLRRMEWARPRMEALGHRIRFSVSRGPLNVASFLMGTTEFLMALKTDPGRAERLLDVVTVFLKRWHALQREKFPTIEGIMMLDDIVGFIGEEDFRQFAYPRLAELYDLDLPVRFFHNDADCASSVRLYPELGINLYNPGTRHALPELHAWTEGRLAFLGSIPPRDVFASAAPEAVASALRRQIDSTPAAARVLYSCAGGMPPGVPSQNVDAFLAELVTSPKKA